jgi:O-antigen ligase
VALISRGRSAQAPTGSSGAPIVGRRTRPGRNQARPKASGAAAQPPLRKNEVGALHYGFWAFLIVAVGRLGNFIPGLASVHLEKVIVILTLIPLVRAWNQLPPLDKWTKPLAINALWFLGLAVILAPLSIWPGATRAFLLQVAPVLITAYVLAFKVSDSWRAVRGSILAMVLSGLILSVSAVSGYHGGRADAAGSMYDPNDLAYVLVTVLPLAFGFALGSTSVPKRLVFAGITLCFVVAALLTGSRGGLLALGAIVVSTILSPVRAPGKLPVTARMPMTKRIVIILLSVAVALVVWNHLPRPVTERFATITHPKAGYNWDPNDVVGRREIWKRGITALEHDPIGYGIATYPMVDLRFGGRFMAPHNSFLEIAVELGVLGAVLFVRMYMLAWRLMAKVRKELAERRALSREEQEQLMFAKLLQRSLVATLVAGFFLSKAYPIELWVIFGLVIALSSVVASDREGAGELGRGG